MFCCPRRQLFKEVLLLVCTSKKRRCDIWFRLFVVAAYLLGLYSLTAAGYVPLLTELKNLLKVSWEAWRAASQVQNLNKVLQEKALPGDLSPIHLFNQGLPMPASPNGNGNGAESPKVSVHTFHVTGRLTAFQGLGLGRFLAPGVPFKLQETKSSRPLAPRVVIKSNVVCHCHKGTIEKIDFLQESPLLLIATVLVELSMDLIHISLLYLVLSIFFIVFL